MKILFFYVDGGIHPKIGQVFHWQQKAIGEEHTKRYEQYLCQVLSSIAQDVKSCDRIYDAIVSVESGYAEKIETGGNDVTLMVDATGVQVNIEINQDWVDDPQGHFEFAEWKLALMGWRRFLELPRSLDSIVEVDL